MRIVTKINIALAIVIGASALLNFTALQLTVVPGFHKIEGEAASRNQGRALEAIEAQKGILANSAKDWAFWDDTHDFMRGEKADYLEKNVNSDSLGALAVNFLLMISPTGKVVVNHGYMYSDDDPAPIRLVEDDQIAAGHPFREPFATPDARSGLLSTEYGFVAVGYAPILTSEQGGEAAGVLVFGRVLDIAGMNAATSVTFDLLPADASAAQTQTVQAAESIETRTLLTGLDGEPLATLSSVTGREISTLGARTVWAAMGLLLLSGLLLVAILAAVLRRIALRRIEAIRSQLVYISETGKIEPIQADFRADELSDMVDSFNLMATQLGELREKVRRQDYSAGAANQAAGILHNIRNAMSPISAILWDLTRAEDEPWKRNLATALEELANPPRDPERAAKLGSFVALSAAKLLDEGQARKADLQELAGVVRHVDEILKDQDSISQNERTLEPIDIGEAAKVAAAMLDKSAHVAVNFHLPAGAVVLGHRIVLEQVFVNLMLNAVEAIGSSRKSVGEITLDAAPVLLDSVPAFDVTIRDDGDGIAAGHLESIFEKGFSTRARPSGGTGLHWCANVVKAMGGRLYAESDGPELGATLHLVLPRAVAHMDVAA